MPRSPDSEEAEVEDLLLNEDLEQGLVDFQTIEAEMEQSGEWDSRRISELVGTAEDKVLVSIRSVDVTLLFHAAHLASLGFGQKVPKTRMLGMSTTTTALSK